MRLIVKAAAAAMAAAVPLLATACSAASSSTTSAASSPSAPSAPSSSAPSSAPSSSATDPLASLTAAQIAADADADLKHASTVHFKGKISAGGSSATYDLTVASGKCKGTIETSAGALQIIQIGETMWVKVGGTTEYLKTTASNQQYQGLTGYCTIAALSGVFATPGMVKGGISEMGGRKVLELKVPDTSMRAYVTDAAKPEYVKADLVDTQLTFSHYNAPVSITAPPASEVISG